MNVFIVSSKQFFTNFHFSSLHRTRLVADGVGRVGKGTRDRCVGSLDGILVNIQCPPLRDTSKPASFYTPEARKSKYALNAQGVCDYRMRFLYGSVKTPGSTHDSNAWNNSNLFGIFWRPIRCKLPTAVQIVAVCMSLHNLCLDHNRIDNIIGQEDAPAKRTLDELMRVPSPSSTQDMVNMPDPDLDLLACNANIHDTRDVLFQRYIAAACIEH
eukprot:598278-Hanusia_phi.AAC.10